MSKKYTYKPTGKSVQLTDGEAQDLQRWGLIEDAPSKKETTDRKEDK